MIERAYPDLDTDETWRFQRANRDALNRIVQKCRNFGLTETRDQV